MKSRKRSVTRRDKTSLIPYYPNVLAQLSKMLTSMTTGDLGQTIILLHDGLSQGRAYSAKDYVPTDSARNLSGRSILYAGLDGVDAAQGCDART
jgi:hypothetical protein